MDEPMLLIGYGSILLSIVVGLVGTIQEHFDKQWCNESFPGTRLMTAASSLAFGGSMVLVVWACIQIRQ